MATTQADRIFPATTTPARAGLRLVAAALEGPAAGRREAAWSLASQAAGGAAALGATAALWAWFLAATW